MKVCVILLLMEKVIWDENNSYALGSCYTIEITMILKDRDIYSLKSFQHEAKLIMKYKDCKEEYLILQANSGHNHNCTNLRNIIYFLMIMNELKLQYLIAMKNTGGLSLYNWIERPMDSVIFGM